MQVTSSKTKKSGVSKAPVDWEVNLSKEVSRACLSFWNNKDHPNYKERLRSPDHPNNSSAAQFTIRKF